jgi:hypothetical protein
MSTKLGDFKNSVQTSVAAYPASVNDSNSTSGIDMIDCDDRCYAIQVVGAVSGTSPTLAGKIQESADNSTWSDVTNVGFTTVTAASNIQVIVFDRTKRYLRHNRTVGGTTPTFLLCVLIGEQKKTI